MTFGLRAAHQDGPLRVTPELVDHVAAVSMFSGLAEPTITKLLSRAAVKTVDHHTLLFSQGDRAHCFYIVVQGQVELYVEGNSSNACVIDVPGPGESFAEEAIFGPEVHQVSAKVIGETRLLVVEAAPFLDQLQNDFDLVRAVTARLSHRLRLLVLQICELRLKSAAQRLGGFVLGLTEAEHGMATVWLPHGKRLLAERLGMTPESLSRALRKLRQIGVEDRNGKVTIDDISKLRSFCLGAATAPQTAMRSAPGETTRTQV